MKIYKQIFLSFFLMIFLTGCATTLTSVPPSAFTVPTLIPVTFTSSAPLASPVSASPSETPTPISEADPTADPSTWSADLQTRFHDVLTSPNTATDQKKADYDAFMIEQWQRVASAEGKTGYDLIDAIVAYTTQNKIHEVAPLPFALQSQILTDPSNWVAYGVGGGMDKNLATSYFGLGFNASDQTLALQRAFAVSEVPWINFFGQKMLRPATDAERETMDLITPVNGGIEGNLVLRFGIPGEDSNKTQEGLIQLVDSSGHTRYMLVVFDFETSQATALDMCVVTNGNHVIGEDGHAGQPIKAVHMNMYNRPTDHKQVTPAKLDNLMDQTGNALHIQMFTGMIDTARPLFHNGATVVSDFIIQSEVMMP